MKSWPNGGQCGRGGVTEENPALDKALEDRESGTFWEPNAQCTQNFVFTGLDEAGKGDLGQVISSFTIS